MAIDLISRRLLLFIGILGCCSSAWAQKGRTGWSAASAIISKMQPPRFPNRVFNITNYGAIGDGKTICTSAIAKAIVACASAGGGRVIIPEGKFLTGPIHLKSKVDLHLADGAYLTFSTKATDYLPLVYTRWEGVELMNYSPLIYAFGQHDIAITGNGTLNGNASAQAWWPWKGLPEYGWRPGTPNQKDAGNRPALFAMAEKGIPVQQRKFGEGHYLRPQFVQPYRCKNVLISGVTMINSPMWIIHPVLCENVIVDGVKTKSDGPNTDGCDPESCKNVWIKNCYFSNGDDCIAVKSGRNADGRRIGIPSENIVIQNCTMANGHGGIVIGSEISGGVRDLFAEDCRMNSPILERALRIKSSSARGGVTENIYLRNIKVGQVKEQAIMATMFYEDSGKYLPAFKNIQIENMQVQRGGKIGIVLEGYPRSPVSGFLLKNVTIANVTYPCYLSNTKDIRFENVRINGKVLSDRGALATKKPASPIKR